jgi:hypothetical protein
MEVQQTIDQQSHHSAFIEWAVARKEKPDGPHRVLLPTVTSSPGGTIAALIDTHSTEEAAAELAREAAEVLAEFTNQSLIELLARVEKKCRSPQGLAINALLANTGVNTISWFGAGNVKGILFHRNAAADPRWQRLDNSPENLGTGQCMLREMRVPVKPGDLIIFATEDVSDSYIEALPIDGKPRVVADALMSQYCTEGTDCAMVVVRFLGAS